MVPPQKVCNFSTCFDHSNTLPAHLSRHQQPRCANVAHDRCGAEKQLERRAVSVKPPLAGAGECATRVPQRGSHRRIQVGERRRATEANHSSTHPRRQGEKQVLTYDRHVLCGPTRATATIRRVFASRALQREIRATGFRGIGFVSFCCRLSAAYLLRGSWRFDGTPFVLQPCACVQRGG